MICPYYKNKEVFDGFNKIIEILGGKPMTEEEFRSSELRNQRTGSDFSAMEAAYRLYHASEGNIDAVLSDLSRYQKRNNYNSRSDYDQSYQEVNDIINDWNDMMSNIEYQQLQQKARDDYKSKLLERLAIYSQYDVRFFYNRETNRVHATIVDDNKRSLDYWYNFFSNFKNGIADAEDVIDEIIYKIHGVSYHYGKVSQILAQALKGKNIKLKFVNSLPKNTSARYDNVNKIVEINKNARFRSTDGRLDQLTPTILHELIHAVTVESIQHSPSLRKELEDLLEVVRSKTYKNTYGTTDIYEFLAELSNYSFTEHLKTIQYDNSNIYVKVKNLLKRLFKEFLSHVKITKTDNTAYSAAMTILMKSVFPNEFDVNDLVNYSLDDKTLFEHKEDAQKLADRFNVLYKTYQRMQNKSVARQKIQNQAFETYNKLKGAEDSEAYEIALEAAQKALGTWDVSTSQPVHDGSVLDWLWGESKKVVPFEGIDADRLSKVWQNSIGFYDNLVTNYIPDEINLDEYCQNLAKSVKSTIDGYIKPLWVKAMATVGDREVDRIIESEVFVMSQEDRDNMKTVAKDWLHKNIMYGDLNAFTSYVYNYSYSSNPIIKMAFHLIQDAETKILEEVHPINEKISKIFRQADKGRFKSDWQTIMMEFNEDGIPTGNFVRPINYGQYEEDVIKFIEDLNQQWERDYGYRYVDDGSGELINSVTGEYATDEEWVGDTAPLYTRYMLEIERFKCERAHRRYTFKYYEERLSRPYTGEVENPTLQQIYESGHGLSPRTIKSYNYIQSNINYYLGLCSDDDGFSHPEELDDVDKQKLDYWYDQMQDLSNPYNDDGTPKTGDERRMALEITAWQTWIGSQLEKNIDWDKFNNAYNEIVAKANSTNNRRLIFDFFKYNSQLQIHPDFLKQTLGSLTHVDSTSPEFILSNYLRRSIQSLVKSDKQYTRDLEKMENKPSFWIECKKLDQTIEDTRLTQSKEYAAMFENSFKFVDILYRDANGFAIDSFGNQVQPQDERNHRDLLTFMQYLVNKYTAVALARPDRTIPGFVDETGNHIVFNGSQQDVKNAVTELFTYSKEFFDPTDDQWKIKHVPLTIFQMMLPASDTFVNIRTGKTEKTILYVPKGRFVESCDKTGIYMDRLYDNKEHIAEQPKVDFIDENGNARYDNESAYLKMMSDENVKNLYNTLIEEMINARKNYTSDKNFDYKLPQINASTMQIWSRIFKNGTGNTLEALWRSATTVEENDEGMRTSDLQSLNPDGSYSTDVPLKFLRKLKHPEYITTDVTSAVIMFINMTTNYKYKQEIDPILKTFRYNLDQDNRQILQKQLKDEISPNDNKNSIKMYDNMLNKHMYENQWIPGEQKMEYNTGDKKQIAKNVASAAFVGGVGLASLMTIPGALVGAPLLSAVIGGGVGAVIGGFGSAGANGLFKGVGLFKIVKNIQRLETTQILAFNIFSMLVGFGDSITRMTKESLMGKYMDMRDITTSLAYVLYQTPRCLVNIGNPIANNKLTRMMQINGVSKGVLQTYGHMNYGKTRKIVLNLLMGGFSMLDWMAQALLMRAFYNNVRYYDGGVVESGFYTAYELRRLFQQAGHKKSEATLAHMMCKTTLWDAYDKDGNIKDEWKDKVPQRVKTTIRSKTIKRGALYNGMNPDNDIPVWKQDIIGGLVGALRAWLPQAIQHLYGGGNDNTVINITKEEKPDVGNKTKTVYTKEKLTQEQLSKAFSFDYETGTAHDQIFRGLGRSIKWLFQNMFKFMLLKKADRSLSDVEKYAIKDAIIYAAVTALLMVGWIPVHDETWNIERPKSREEAGPSSMTPWGIANYMYNVYIPKEYYKLAASDIYFRIIESQITSVDPKSSTDVIKSITAIASGLNDHLGILLPIADITGISGHTLDEVIKQQSYKYYTRAERDLYKFIGFLDNIHTVIAPEHTIANERFYTNTYGWIYKMFGVDFSKPEEYKNTKSKTDTKSKNKSVRGKSSRGKSSSR